MGITTVAKQNKTNHIKLLIDCSGSMAAHKAAVIRAVDAQVKFLADLSQQMNQETRISIYQFDDRFECLVFDMDVLRAPSIKGLYEVRGMTALIDAAWQVLDDVESAFVKYGDHAFLVYIYTDGAENKSYRHTGEQLRLRTTVLDQARNDLTIAGFVPDFNGRMALEGYGIPKGNISVWDTTSATGYEEASVIATSATQTWMTSRSTGLRSSKTLFSTDANAVNAQAIAAAGLVPLDAKRYALVPVTAPRRAKGEGVENKDKHLVWEIQAYVEKLGEKFRVGNAFYELSKKEKIGGNKLLAVLEVATSKIFVGDGVRAMIGLPDGDKTVAPDFNPDYKIFVQSQSHNRHLVHNPSTKILILKD